MRIGVRHAGFCALFLSAACGGAEPQPVLPVATATAAQPEAPAGPDLSPVAEPGGVFLVARWKGPIKNADEALAKFGSKFSLESLLNDEAKDVAKVLDLEGSVDAAALLDPESTENDPKVLGAVSIPLKSFDEAQVISEKEGELANVRPGILRVTPKKSEKTVCDLALAPVTTGSPVGAPSDRPDAKPARLVCGEKARDVEMLRDWLVRGLGRSAPASEGLTMTLRAGPIKDRYLGKARAEAAKGGEEARAFLSAQNVTDPELLGAATVALDEGIRFLEDLDRVEIHGGLDAGKKRASAGGSIHFAGRTSWITQVFTDVNDHAGPAPDMFWHLPKDAYSATWARGGDPRQFDGVRRVLRKALVEALGRAPIPPADKASLEAFVDGVPRTPGVLVSSAGSVPVKKKPGAKADAAGDAKGLITTAIGWHVWGVEAPSAEYVAWAKQGLDVYNRGVRLVRSFATESKKTPSPKPTGTPGAKGGGAPKTAAPKKDDNAWLDLIPRVTTQNNPPGWPKGTVAFDVAFKVDADIAAAFASRKADKLLKKALDTKAAPAPKVSMTVRLAIVPDGTHTWIGVSADLDQLKQHMIATLAGAPADGTLASRGEDLEGLKGNAARTWGGFLGFGDILERTMETVERESPKEAAEARALLASLPNHGRTPILMFGSGAPGPQPSTSVEVLVQQGTLADIASLVSFLTSPAGRAILKKL